MSVTISQLNNGLQIVTDTMPGVETVALGLWFKVGARYEKPEHSGMAHFLEHLLFKGTARRSAFAISEEIEAKGGYLNAYTCLLYTSPSPRDRTRSRMPSSA